LDYDTVLAKVDAEAAVLQQRAAERNEWLDYERLALAHMERARLTGGIDAWAAADAAIEHAFSVAPVETGPYLTRARLNLALHRNDQVVADLQAAANATLVDDTTRASIEAMYAQLAFASGDFDAVEKHLAAGRALDPDNTNVRTMAMQLAWKTGDFDKARAELETMRSEHRAD